QSGGKQSTKSSFTIIRGFHSAMQQRQVKHQHDHRTCEPIFLNKNGKNEICKGVGKYVSLVTVAGAFAQYSARGDGDQAVLRLKLRILLSLDKLNVVVDP